MEITTATEYLIAARAEKSCHDLGHKKFTQKSSTVRLCCGAACAGAGCRRAGQRLLPVKIQPKLWRTLIQPYRHIKWDLFLEPDWSFANAFYTIKLKSAQHWRFSELLWSQPFLHHHGGGYRLCIQRGDGRRLPFQRWCRLEECGENPSQRYLFCVRIIRSLYLCSKAWKQGQVPNERASITSCTGSTCSFKYSAGIHQPVTLVQPRHRHAGFCGPVPLPHESSSRLSSTIPHEPKDATSHFGPLKKTYPKAQQ